MRACTKTGAISVLVLVAWMLFPPIAESGTIKAYPAFDNLPDRGVLRCSVHIQKQPQKIDVESAVAAMRRKFIRMHIPGTIAEQDLAAYAAALEADRRGTATDLAIESYWMPGGARQVREGQTLVTGARYRADIFQLGPDRCQINRLSHSVTIEPRRDVRVGTWMTSQVLTWGVSLNSVFTPGTIRVTTEGGATVVRGVVGRQFLKTYSAATAAPVVCRAEFGDAKQAVPQRLEITRGGQVVQAARASDFRPFGLVLYPTLIRIADYGRKSTTEQVIRVQAARFGNSVAPAEFVPTAEGRTSVIDQRFGQALNYRIDAGSRVPTAEEASRRYGNPLAGVVLGPVASPVLLARLFAVIVSAAGVWLLLHLKRVRPA